MLMGGLCAAAPAPPSAPAAPACPQNVLLVACRGDPRGFSCRLGDFGFATELDCEVSSFEGWIMYRFDEPVQVHAWLQSFARPL
jgi:hypothetical protein